MMLTDHSRLRPASSILFTRDFWPPASTPPDGQITFKTHTGQLRIIRWSFQGIPVLTVRNSVLKPGGWVQIIECYYMCQSDAGAIDESHALRQWSDLYMSSIEGLKDPRAPLRLHNWLTAANFRQIEVKMLPVPLCGWPRGKQGLSLRCYIWWLV